MEECGPVCREVVGLANVTEFWSKHVVYKTMTLCLKHSEKKCKWKSFLHLFTSFEGESNAKNMFFQQVLGIINNSIMIILISKRIDETKKNYSIL